MKPSNANIRSIRTPDRLAIHRRISRASWDWNLPAFLCQIRGHEPRIRALRTEFSELHRARYCCEKGILRCSRQRWREHTVAVIFAHVIPNNNYRDVIIGRYTLEEANMKRKWCHIISFLCLIYFFLLLERNVVRKFMSHKTISDKLTFVILSVIANLKRIRVCEPSVHSAIVERSPDVGRR